MPITEGKLKTGRERADRLTSDWSAQKDFPSPLTERELTASPKLESPQKGVRWRKKRLPTVPGDQQVSLLPGCMWNKLQRPDSWEGPWAGHHSPGAGGGEVLANSHLPNSLPCSRH